MLYQPTNIYPSMTGSLGNGVIDAAKDLTVSWQVNGNSAMVGYQVAIYKNDSSSTQVYSTGKLTSGCPFYGVDYAGNVQFFSCTITASTLSGAGITNGGSYKLIIKQWWGSTDDQSVSQTSASAFIARSTPSLAIASVPSPLAVKEYSFTANYSQEQGDVLSWVQWKLALVAEGGEYKILKDTGNIYGTAQLKFDYDGFFSGSTYSVMCSIQTQNGVEVNTGWKNFSVEYETTPLSGSLTAIPNRKSNGIKLTFPPVTNIPADITGSYTMEDSYLNLPDGSSAVWNEVNGNQMNFEAPFGIAWSGKGNAIGTVLKVTGSTSSDVGYGTLPSSAKWKSVCYGAGKFVAVDEGNSNKAAYSRDGITWTATTLPQSGAWDSVCYGNGKFVAVAYSSGSAAYSDDGITWTATTMPKEGTWISVCYGGGKFVAVSYESDVAAYSTDGITWTAVTMTKTANWQCICYGDDKFVAIIDQESAAAYSTDGITWVETVMPSKQLWQSVCYGGGKFVVVSYDSNAVAYSTDGITWSSTTMQQVSGCASVCYGDGRFVSVASGHNVISYSVDGITWESELSGKFAGWNSIAYGDGSLVAVRESEYSLAITQEPRAVDESIIVEISDNMNWTSMNFSLGSGSGSPHVCYGNGMFFAIKTGTSLAAYSTDGINWAETTMPSSYDWQSVCYGAGKFVAVANDSNVSAYSANGSIWTITELPQKTLWSSVCYGDGKFIAISGGATNAAAYSTDGITWNSTTMPQNAAWEYSCYGDNKFVAVATLRGAAAYSIDGITWVTTTMPESANWRSVCYGNGKFVTVAGNTAAYSIDGITWVKMALPQGADWHSVCYGDGVFVAVAFDSNIFAYSYDGISWYEVELQSSVRWYFACYGDGKFVAAPWSSTDGACGVMRKSIDVFRTPMTETAIAYGDAVQAENISFVIGNSGLRFNGTDGPDSFPFSFGWDSLKSIELYGVQSCDYLFISDGELSDSAIENILTDSSYRPDDLPTLFFADFNGSTNGGGVGDTKISAFAIYRRSGEDEVLTHVIDTSAEDGNVLIDCSAVTGTQYTYYAYGVGTSTFESSALISSSVTPCFWDWALLSCTTDTNGVYHPQQIFLFSNNVSSGDVSNNNSPNVLQNFTRYPTVQPSPWNYRSGALTSLIGSVSGGKYCDSTDLRNAITELSTASRTLFLKNRKGDLIKIALSGAIEMETMDNSPQQAQTMKLPWVEIGDASGVSIVMTQSDGAWVQSLDSPVVMGCCGTGSGAATSYAYPLTILQQGKTTVYDGSEPKKVVIKDGGGSGEIVAEDDGNGNITIY